MKYIPRGMEIKQEGIGGVSEKRTPYVIAPVLENSPGAYFGTVSGQAHRVPLIFCVFSMSCFFPPFHT